MGERDRRPVGLRCSVFQPTAGPVVRAVTQVEVDRFFGIIGVRNIMLVIRANQHKAEIGNILAGFEPPNIFKHVIAVVRLTVVHFLEELDLDRAAPVSLFLSAQPEPDIDAASSVAAAPQRLFQLDRESFVRIDDMQVGDCGDDPPQMQLQRRFTLAEGSAAPHLLEEGWYRSGNYSPEAGDGHHRR